MFCKSIIVEQKGSMLYHDRDPLTQRICSVVKPGIRTKACSFMKVARNCFKRYQTSSLFCDKPNPVRNEVLKLKPHKTGNLCVIEQRSTFMFPLLQRKSNIYYIFWMQGCSLRYTACEVHVPYHHLWPAQLYSIFPQYFINGTIKKKVMEHKMWVWISSTTFVWNIFHSTKNWVGYDQKSIFIFMYSTCYSCLILIKRELSPQILKKYWNIKFYEICPVGAELFHVERCIDTMQLWVAFYNFANAPKNSERNLLQRHYIHNKPTWNHRGLTLCPHGEKHSSFHLSYSNTLKRYQVLQITSCIYICCQLSTVV